MNRVFQLMVYVLLVACTAFAQQDFPLFPDDTVRQQPALIDLDESELGLLMTLPPVPVPSSYYTNPPALPYAVNNSLLPFFRPAYNQAGLSCGQATLVGYNFTYEINRLRNLPGNVPDNQYPSHFAWNWVNGGQGWYGASYFHTMDLLRHVGTPNVTVYGGMSAGGGTRWMSGYNSYYHAMQNRIYDAYSIDVSTIAGLQILKHYLHDHLEGSPYGGLVSFYANPPTLYNLPAGTPEAGKKVVIAWGTANHAMSFVGYNDSIRWDYNGDNQYTNHIDINGDGKVDLRDWEIGGVIMVNSYGGVPNWGDGGFAYVMYKTLAEPYGSGGIWNNAVHLLKPKQTTQPQVTMKVKIKHTSRNKLKITAGISTDLNATSPAVEMDFPIIHYQGDNMYMQGGMTEADKTIEVGLDVTPLLSLIPSGQEARYFFRVYENDPNNAGSGEIVAYSLMNYTFGLQEIVCPGLPIPIVENGKTTVWVNATVFYNPVAITTDSLPPAKTYEPYNYQLQAAGGQNPYHWYLKMNYTESQDNQPFPNVNQQQLSVTNSSSGYATKILDFPFPFYGKYYDTLYIRVDGLIMFDKQLYPWPYQNEPWVLFKGYKNISPFNVDLKINSGQGIWYQGNADYAIFRWKVSLESSSINEMNFAVKLYPSGKIEFFYGTMMIPTSFSLEWIGGLASGDYRNQHYISISNSSSIASNTRIVLDPPAFIPELKVSPSGLISGTFVNEYQNTPVTFLAEDNNTLFATKTLMFNTRGFRTYYTVNSGGDNVIEFGETALMSLTLKSMEYTPLQNLTVTLASDDPYVSVLNNTLLIYLINPGDSLHFTNAFMFEVSNQIPDNYLIPFILTITSATESWTRHIGLRGFAPVVKPVSVIVLDNQNGILDPGETADLKVTVKNKGGALVNNLSLSLSSANPGITITQGSAYLPALAAGASAPAMFSIIASETISSGTPLYFTLTISGHNQYAATETFYLIAGLVVENFESGGFNAFPWQFSGNKPWTIETSTPYEGIYCARSGIIDHSQSSAMEITLVITSADTISFYRKVSSEANYDYLRFFINNTQMGQWSGESAWTRAKFLVTPGVKTFKWSYVKDNSIVAGQDLAMIDYITFPPMLSVFAGQDQYVCEVQPVQLNGYASNYTSLTWTTSGSGTFSNPSIPKPFYTPSLADLNTGYVVLTLTASSQTAGSSLSDQVSLYFLVPLTPGNIAGPTEVNLNFTGQSNYSISTIPNALTYEWTIEPTESGVIIGNSTQATVTWNPDFLGTAIIKVRGVNNCGNGPFSPPCSVFVYRPGVGVSLPVQQGFIIQPNPNKGRFMVFPPASVNSSYVVKVHDTHGETIFEALGFAQQETLVELAKPSKGIYIVEIRTSEAVYYQKIVVF